MLAARFHDWGAQPVIDEIDEPVRDDGQFLVEVQAGAIAHLDVTIAGGDFGMRPELPYIGGVEGAGVVLEADPDSGIEPGTQVMLRGGGLGMLRDGTWAERRSVPAKAVTPLAHRLPPEVAATFFVPATTAYVALHDIGRIERNEEVIIVGAAGAVGSMAVQQALAAGATVVGVVGREERLDDVPAGAEPVSLTSPEAMTRLAEARSASLLIDTLGGQGLIERSRWVCRGGRAVAIGYVAGTDVAVDLPSWLLDDVALLPVNMIRRERRAREVAGELVTQLASGKLTVDVQRYELADTALALDDLRGGRVRGRPVVTPKARR